jgi:uncharacterized repeat protein (TIGR01451 family)
VRLSAIPGVPVFVAYATAAGSAQAGNDYVHTNSFIIFPAGNALLTRNFTVPVRGDTEIEPNEFFRVLLTPTNAVAVNTQALCHILADDGRGVLHHFAWSPIPSPQQVGVPFAVNLAAEDAFNSLVTNFTGAVALSAGTGAEATNIFGGAALTNEGSGDFTIGIAFIPKAELTVTHFRHYVGTKVSLWTDAGLTLASENVTGPPGEWSETPLASPVRLSAGAPYVLAFYTGGGEFRSRPEPETDFADVILLSGRYQTGDQFPDLDPEFIGWSVDIRYTVGSLSVPVVLTPTHSGNFVEGRWSGEVTLHTAATNVTLRAVEAEGRSGVSGSFDVVETSEADVWVELKDLPGAILEGSNVTYTVTVHNRGPAAAGAVTLTHILPESFVFVGATPSQGTTSPMGTTFSAALGMLPGGGLATILVTIRPKAQGVYTNRVSASSDGPDPAPGNNHASKPLTVFRDTDGDGLWNSWEVRYRFDPGDAADAGEDADGDGHSNRQEFLSGTDPRDPGSVTRIVRVVSTSSGSRVTAQGGRGKTYRLERQDPPSESWVPVLTFRIGASPRSSETVEVFDAVPPFDSTRFYRIQLVPE